MLGWLILVHNEIEVLNMILEKVSNIETTGFVIQNAILYFLAGIVAIFVCYLFYKAVANFISF